MQFNARWKALQHRLIQKALQKYHVLLLHLLDDPLAVPPRFLCERLMLVKHSAAPQASSSQTSNLPYRSRAVNSKSGGQIYFLIPNHSLTRQKNFMLAPPNALRRETYAFCDDNVLHSLCTPIKHTCLTFLHLSFFSFSQRQTAQKALQTCTRLFINVQSC